MKTILLHLTFILTAITTQAQYPGVSFSIESMLQPTDTIYYGNSNNPIQQTLELRIKNNNTSQFNSGTRLFFSMKLDGDSIPDTQGGIWSHELTSAMLSGDEITAINDTWIPQTTPGNHDLCVELYFVSTPGPPPHPYTNTDTQKEICKSFIFEFIVGTDNYLESPEISKITVREEQMTLISRNISGLGNVQIINMVGQVLHSETINPAQTNNYSQINISQIPTGIYLVNIEGTQGFNVTKKVFIP